MVAERLHAVVFSVTCVADCILMRSVTFSLPLLVTFRENTVLSPAISATEKLTFSYFPPKSSV